jgi:streptogramin lyase
VRAAICAFGFAFAACVAHAQLIPLPGSTDPFHNIYGVAVDTAGNVYVAETLSVTKLARVNGTLSSPVTLPAGSGFGRIGGIAVDTVGNVFVTDAGNNAVKMIALVAGVYQDPVVLPPGAGYNSPNGIAVDLAGNVYVADTNNHAIKRINRIGATFAAPVSLPAGSGFLSPQGVAVDAAGNVFVADQGAGIKKLSWNGSAYLPPIIIASSAQFPQFQYLVGVAVDAAGNVYAGDYYNYVLKVEFSGGVYLPPVALPTLQYDSLRINGVAVDAAGNVYAADDAFVRGAVLSARLDGVFQIPVRLAGGIGGQGGATPTGITVDAAGNVFVAEIRHNRVRMLGRSGALYDPPAFVPAAGAGLWAPSGLATGPDGSLFVADTLDNAISTPRHFPRAADSMSRGALPSIAPAMYTWPTHRTVPSRRSRSSRAYTRRRSRCRPAVATCGPKASPSTLPAMYTSPTRARTPCARSLWWPARFRHPLTCRLLRVAFTIRQTRSPSMREATFSSRFILVSIKLSSAAAPICRRRRCHRATYRAEWAASLSTSTAMCT